MLKRSDLKETNDNYRFVHANVVSKLFSFAYIHPSVSHSVDLVLVDIGFAIRQVHDLVVILGLILIALGLEDKVANTFAV